MKKTFSKALSLLLVLAMLLSVMPMALATESNTPEEPEESVTVNSLTMKQTISINVGATDTLDAEVDPTESEITYESDTPAVASVDSTGTVTGVNVGTATITATSGDKTATCEVTVDTTMISIVGGNRTIEIPDGTCELAVEPSGAKVTWKSSDPKVASVGETTGLVTAKDNGTATITATYKAGIEATTTITVAEGALKVAAVEDVELAVGEEDSRVFKLNYKPDALGTANPKFTVTAIGDSSIVDYKVSGDNVVELTGKAPGTTTITVGCTNVENVATETFTVRVTSGYVTCGVASTEAKVGAKVTLMPKYSASSTTAGSVAKYEYTITNRTTASFGTPELSDDTKSATIAFTGTVPAAAEVTIKAYDANNNFLGDGVTYISFFLSKPIEVSMPKNEKYMYFSLNSDNNEGIHLSTAMLGDYSYPATYRVKLAQPSVAAGKLNMYECSPADLGKVFFTAGTSGSADIPYQVTPGAEFGNVPMVDGIVSIDYDGADGDITYSTTYNKAITFDESDFAAFWKKQLKGSNLSYVTFSQPVYGDLYTSTTSTASKYKASETDKFYYNSSYTTGNGIEDLDSVTYVPDSKKTYTYDDMIQFTARGVSDADVVTGYVVIHLNQTDNEITSRGIPIGSTYADLIAATYKTAESQKLSFVIFDVPAVEKASLFFYVPEGSGGEGRLISKGQKVPNNQRLVYSTNEYANDSLNNVFVVPAADYYGKITLTYTAYDINGKNPYEGTLTFNVTKKTESAVFSDMTKSYNWAYDSVDFLYYDEISQGSVKGYNRYYNPSANITRGDFMLMLYRAFLAEDYSDYNVKDNFNDMVKGNTEYSQETFHAVGVAKYLGISNGTNGKYNPKANITREEAMTLIYRTLEEMNRELEYDSNVSASSFRDYSKISSYAKTAISNLVDHGIIVGNNGYVNPKNNITRAEMACILHRVITY